MIDFKIKERIHLNKKQYCYCNLDDIPLNDEWYDDARDFCDSFAGVRKNGLGWNFINTAGKLISDQWFDDASYFYNGFASVKLDGQGWNFLSTDGKLISDQWFDWVGQFFDGFARVEKVGLGENFINTAGKLISDEWYDDAWHFKNGFGRVALKGKGWNHINTEGKPLSEQWFDSVDNFENGFAKVYKTAEDYDNDVYYYLGTDGKLYNSNKVNNKMTKEQAREYLKEKKFCVSNITEARNVAKILKNLDIDILPCFMYGFSETLNPFYHDTEDKYKEDKHEEILLDDILSIEIIEEEPEPVEKFDFSILKPFDMVLVRDLEHEVWVARFFDYCECGFYYTTSSACSWKYCVPYCDETKHLHRTTLEAPVKYKQ